MRRRRKGRGEPACTGNMISSLQLTQKSALQGWSTYVHLRTVLGAQAPGHSAPLARHPWVLQLPGWDGRIPTPCVGLPAQALHTGIAAPRSCAGETPLGREFLNAIPHFPALCCGDMLTLRGIAACTSAGGSQPEIMGGSCVLLPTPHSLGPPPSPLHSSEARCPAPCFQEPQGSKGAGPQHPHPGSRQPTL